MLTRRQSRWSFRIRHVEFLIRACGDMSREARRVRAELLQNLNFKLAVLICASGLSLQVTTLPALPHHNRMFVSSLVVSARVSALISIQYARVSVRWSKCVRWRTSVRFWFPSGKRPPVLIALSQSDAISGGITVLCQAWDERNEEVRSGAASPKIPNNLC